MRRFSFATTETNDPGVDESLRNLYADSETLEKMCLESITANPMLNSLKVDSNHSRLVDTKFSDNVLEGLSTEYFDPDFDPVEAHLKEISSWDDYGVTEKFMNTISDADTDKDIVLGHLATMIEANYGDLMNCIKNVHQIDVDLSSAGIHINVARRKIKECSSLISRGGMKTITLHKKRERLQTLSETISSLKAVKDVHQAMTKSITTGEVGKAAEYAYEVLQCLKSNSFDRYASLTKIANSASNSILLIRQKADKALKRLCGRKFAASEYDNILTSYLFLDHIAEAISVDSVDCVEDSGESFYLDSNNCLEGLSQRINRYQLEDIDSCLHTAVVEHIYSTQHRKQKAAAALEVKGAYSTMNFGEIVDLTEIPLNVLYRRITGDSIAPCIIRSCKLLTDVVHTHYLITQWHTSPFDERNEDWKFLHRCAINLSDIEIDRKSVADMMLNFEDEAIDSTNDFDCKTVQSFNLKSELQKRVNTVISAEAKSSLTNAMENNLKVVEDSLSSKSTLVKLVRLHQEKLTDSYQKLAQSRSILWEEMSRSLIDMLNMMTVTSAVKPDDFLALAWALNTMIVIGKEFCGSDSKTLVQILEDKSREYSQHFHFESYNMVRQMLEVEIWQKFPIDLDEAGGIIGLMRTSLAITDKTVEVSEEVDNEELETSILMGFGGKGNPFASMMEKHSDIDCKVRQDQFSKNRVYSSSLIKLLQESIVDSTSKSNDGYIVTQAAINGIIKYVSKYLQLMYIIPTTTLDLFHNLCQLFDYYICSVFYGFVPQDERSRLLSSSTKMNIVAPDQSREYEVLLTFMDRCLSEQVAIGIVRNETVGSNGSNLDVDSADSTMNLSPGSGTPTSSTHGSSNHGNNATTSFNLVKLNGLLRVPQVLDDPSPDNCYHINEYIVAAESCAFIAKVLSEIRLIIMSLLPESSLLYCDNYISQFQIISSQLRSLLYRVMCPMMVNHSSILSAVVDSGWDSKKLRENHHEWVDQLVRSCETVWNHLLQMGQFTENFAVIREQVWIELCQSCFDLALEGFSKVRKCSAEGRAAMSMDIFSLHEGLGGIHLCRPARGKHYVDNYLRATYMPEEDIMVWVRENYRSYAYRHMHGLLSQTMNSVLNTRKLKDAVAVIDSLYEVDKSDTSKSMLSMEASFTNMISSRLRR